MARPTTKTDLIQAANDTFEKLQLILQSMSSDEKNAPFSFDTSKEKGAHWERDKNTRDVLIHLYEWHQLLIDWVTCNIEGNHIPFLPLPYNWRTYGELNITFTKKHQTTSYIDAENLLLKSHFDVLIIIEAFDNDALFSKGALTWTGGSTLGSYCVSATSSHYEWAAKKLRKHLKTFK